MVQFWPRGWDSRECPGPISEATLHRPSPRRALTAGAIALAVIAPALDPVEHAAEAVDAVPPISPTRAEPARLGPHAAFQERVLDAQRASRTAVRGAAPARPAVPRVQAEHARQRVWNPDRIALLAAARTARLTEWAVAREVQHSTVHRNAEVTGSGSSLSHQIRRATRAERATLPHRNTVRAVVTKHAVVTQATRRVPVGGGMSAVVAYARSQVGKRYVTGGEGGGGFDCSGLTKRAYALAGIRLPHSSGAQAARARAISRAVARPGDLVVGRGHVGIYMGRGMMIDAGNHRIGVVYRKLYSGLRVERL